MHHEYQPKKRRPVAEINVVPYIDVMLVLLIIFMATAPLVVQGVKVDLPQAQAQQLPEDTKPPIVASVDKEGNYYLNLGDNRQQQLAGDELAALVKMQLEKAPDTPVVVRGDGAVLYRQVIALMVVLQQQAGVASVGLMTEPEE